MSKQHVRDYWKRRGYLKDEPEQLTIPVPEGKEDPIKSCAWCGRPAYGAEFEVEPARIGVSRGQSMVKKRAVTAPACAQCKIRLSTPE